jgi:membrane protease YdiL (CAAX protease family)
VLAPLLEETLFRGFLLTSLTKFMSTPAAIFASSLAFGVAHLSLRDLPVLVALGCLLGALYVRSRNLLTPMLVHGVWNSSVLTLLFALTAAGVDVQQLLREGGL